ncbi:DNA repair protein RadA [hydrothermal vent metagenome]|uniref:DNA repair protein RadA n=1 Tax=hydrothermal vent metagenome TaxID=652676 RepID=A0A3B1CN56_9ZZZZ
MAKTSSVYVCQACGFKTSKWLGKCPSCGQWDSLSEEIQSPASMLENRKRWSVTDGHQEPVALSKVVANGSIRISTGSGELDRTLGGGIVAGSFTLVGGDPGIGKSTLLLQVAGHVARGGVVLYVSGEESPHQIKMRGERLGLVCDNILALPETQVEEIERHIMNVKPNLVIIDSIQTIYTGQLPSAPGTVGQVREAAGRLLNLCKATGIPMVLIGHVTKEGAIAGPRLLEHMVDTVLYFEGEKGGPYRILRGVKNRFGATNEIGVFEMKSEGLTEVDNPSELFLSDRPKDVAGSVVVACVNGTRPMLVEVQALVATTHYANPKRTTSGVDPNRLAILMAIIEKRAGYHLMGEDVFVNAAGGARIDEPGVDMGVITAVVSSFRDIAVDSKTVIMGEVGLSGEIRAVTFMEARISEAAKLGFVRAIVPKSKKPGAWPKEIEVIEVSDVSEALEIVIGA